MERREGSEILTQNEITHLLFLFTACFNHQELSGCFKCSFQMENYFNWIAATHLPHYSITVTEKQIGIA